MSCSMCSGCRCCNSITNQNDLTYLFEINDIVVLRSFLTGAIDCIYSLFQKGCCCCCCADMTRGEFKPMPIIEMLTESEDLRKYAGLNMDYSIEYFIRIKDLANAEELRYENDTYLGAR